MRCLKVIILIYLIILSGCDKNGPTGPSHGLRAETYMPLKIGAVWTYSVSIIDEYGNESTRTDTTIIEKTEKISQNNETYFVMVEGEGEVKYIRIANNKVYSYSHTESQESVMLNFDVESGETWLIYEKPDSWLDATMTGIFFGTESISVPAGTFKNCAKFESRMVMELSDNTGEVIITDELFQVSWLAPDVGLVKSSGGWKRNNELIGSAMSELISYDIPE